MSEKKAISLNAPAELIDEVDELVRAEAQQIGLPVDRTGFIVRAIRESVEARRELLQAAAAKGAA